MSLKPLRLIVVGRPRAAFWRDAAAHYLERLARWRAVTETVVRDADPALPPARKTLEEGKNILRVLVPGDIVICLDERGVTRTSRNFARWLDELSADATRRPCFVVGGPFGLDDAVRARARHMVAFGAQTLPHELARVLLLEQLYRAESLLRNTPYHHE